MGVGVQPTAVRAYGLGRLVDAHSWRWSVPRNSPGGVTPPLAERGVILDAVRAAALTRIAAIPGYSRVAPQRLRGVL
jgi:hypothetical protein